MSVHVGPSELIHSASSFLVDMEAERKRYNESIKHVVVQGIGNASAGDSMATQKGTKRREESVTVQPKRASCISLPPFYS